LTRRYRARFFKTGIDPPLALPLEWTGVNPGSTKVPMKVLAPKKQTISLEFPLKKRRTWRFALVNPRTLVPSTLDFMRVNNATVREGRSHRVWPPDVLRKFQTAEIVTELQTPHYVLRDRSISPVKI
jgi:hypothetical protein